MNRKISCRLESRDWRKKQPAGFSLFELLISLSLFALVIMLLITVGTQAAKMWSESEEQEEMMAEGGALLQIICRDLRSSFLSEKIDIDAPHARGSKNIFFLTRTPSDNLVTVGYFFDPSKNGHCYRFFAKTKETLEARNKRTLVELYEHASADEAHCELIATHLLSWEITPIWKSEEHLIPSAFITPGETIPPPSLLEINMSFGKTTPSYFLSTVIALPPSHQ